MHLLQVCNVGDICGGTAACAWTIMRALPNWQHSVWFFSRPTDETRIAFQSANLNAGPHLTRREVNTIGPDVILWHNVAASRMRDAAHIPGIQYQHSGGLRGKTDGHVFCSKWLATKCGQPEGRVLYQAVPVPPRPVAESDRSSCDRLVVGRICTPKPHKWPQELVPFYGELAVEFPTINWEFVGAPRPLRPALHEACDGRATFLPAGSSARQHLWRWDALLYRQPACVESFGRVCAEAMRTGCIPIVDDLGGFREQVAPGSGFLCGETDAFCEALTQLMDPQRRRDYSIRAKACGDARFSLLRFQRDFRSLTQEVLLQHRG